ncbi:MAG: S41 family peptidase [Anaerolineales bacterium]
MSTSRRTFILAAFIIPALALAFIFGAWAESRTQVLSSRIPSNARGEFDLMAEAWNLIQENYVDRSAIQPQRMTYSAISGMVDSLGDTGHSIFLSPDMVKEEQVFMQGHFDGVGLEVQMKNGQVVIVAPIDASPAQKAGLRPGEIITKVDGQDIKGLTLIQVGQKIMGPLGTSVTLTIQNPQTGLLREYTLQRAEIEIHNVIWHVVPGTNIVHLRIAGFSQGVTQDLLQALQDIQGQGYTRLILDLRNGAEIVSGALQDAHRAELIGETTFGTGTVLNQFSLSDGSALMLATEEWLTPDGQSIWHNGITPDIQVMLPDSALPLFPEAEGDMTTSQFAASEDAQLLRAVQSFSAMQDQ